MISVLFEAFIKPKTTCYQHNTFFGGRDCYIIIYQNISKLCLYVLSVSERLLNGVCLRSVVSLQLLFVHRLSFPAKTHPGRPGNDSVPLGTWLGSWYHGYISVYINDIIWWEYNSLSPIEKEESKISLHDIRSCWCEFSWECNSYSPTWWSNQTCYGNMMVITQLKFGNFHNIIG